MSSEYINSERKAFALYTLQHRAIPHAADGLKAAARRLLWVAKSGAKYKSASLAGATMPYHPHAEASGTINTLAAPYGNNIPLFKGDGAFGTLLNPTAYGAARYTSVTVSQFTKDVMFRDIECVPLIDNYDGTLKEPKYFLPLIPIAVLNPQEGIAVGFATNILPRTLDDIISAQINYLKGKLIKLDFPEFTPIDSRCKLAEKTSSGADRWIFEGEFKKKNATTVVVTKLPYNISHSKFISKLANMEDDGTIQEITDNSKNIYHIEIRFKKGTLRGKSDSDINKLLGLISGVNENMTVIGFDGLSILPTSYVELISKFTEWRVQWYKARYSIKAESLELDIQKYKDIMLAIKHNVGGLAKSIKSRNELKEFLKEIGVVHVDYIANLPIYRFTEEERKAVKKQLDDAMTLMKEYKQIIASDKLQRELYICELQEIKSNHKKGKYDTPS